MKPGFIHRWRIRRILRREAIAFKLWHAVSMQLPLVACRTPCERARLRLLSTLFLHNKRFSAANGLVLNEEMKLVIAAQACIPILALGIEAYRGWREIVVYPDAFVVDHEYVDDVGVVHRQTGGLSGEAWERGPLILSWHDVELDSFSPEPGHHVVIHEFSHKLDMQNGYANGMPPLHADMSGEQWAQDFSRAFALLNDRLDHALPVAIDDYAASDPAEFFAVICEMFFTAPRTLRQHCPEVYQQLQQYFRQDPATVCPERSVPVPLTPP